MLKRNKANTKNLIKHNNHIQLRSYWIALNLLLAFIFIFFTFFLNTSVSSISLYNGVNLTNSTYYLQANVFIFNQSTLQIIWLLNPFLITSTVFVSIVLLSAIYFWIDYLLRNLYLFKLFKAQVFFDNAFYNQLIIYILCFYIPIWVSICTNPYLLNEHFSFYNHGFLVSSNGIIFLNYYGVTSGAIVFLFFFVLFTAYITTICLISVNKDEAKQFVLGALGMKKVLVFGATGTIGQIAIKMIDLHPSLFHLVGFTYFNNHELAKEIYHSHKNTKFLFSSVNKELSNVNNYEELILKTKPDLIINAISGIAGVEVSLLSIKHHINLALANKESLVVAGSLLMNQAKENNVNIYPIDSEHATLKALIDKYKQDAIKNYIITCSGGPFYDYDSNELINVSFEQAIKHPNWHMGAKISIDSATLMNKAFELIEARWLFDTKNVSALYHPQSKVHALIELKNNEVIAALSTPDMTLPVYYAMNDFQCNEPLISNLSFNDLTLHFDYLNKTKWNALSLVDLYFEQYENTTFGVIICTLDEVAISMFKNEQLHFNEIVPFILTNYKKFKIEELNDLNQILDLKDQILATYKIH